MSARWRATERAGAKRLPARVLDFDNFSPDRRFVAVAAVPPNGTLPQTSIFPLDGSAAIPICNNLCLPTWSPDGRYLYLQIPDKSGQNSNARTAVVPIPPGQSLPPIPPAAVDDPAEWANAPGAKIIDRYVHLARAGSVHVRLYQTVGARQSFSDTAALTFATPSRSLRGYRRPPDAPVDRAARFPFATPRCDIRASKTYRRAPSSLFHAAR